MLGIVLPSLLGPTLKDTLNSLRSQSNQNFLVLLVNDTLKDIEEVKDDWFVSHVTVLHGPRKGWAGPPRNVAIRYAKTNGISWLGFVDDDDYLHPKYVEWLYEHCNITPHADIVVFRARGKFDHIPETFVIPPAGCMHLVAGLVTNSFAVNTETCLEYAEDNEDEMALLYKTKQVKGPGEDIAYLRRALDQSKIIVFSHRVAYGVRIPIHDTSVFPLLQLYR